MERLTRKMAEMTGATTLPKDPPPIGQAEIGKDFKIL